MRKIIEGIEFSGREYQTCSQYVLAALLPFYGYKVEDILFSDWSFMYKRTGTTGFHISPGPIDMAGKFFDHGILMEYKQAENADEAWSALRDMINQDKPVQVMVDHYYFEFLFPGDRSHVAHYLILTGYDDDDLPWGGIWNRAIERMVVVEALEILELDNSRQAIFAGIEWDKAMTMTYARGIRRERVVSDMFSVEGI